jgi:hypothetical protein
MKTMLTFRSAALVGAALWLGLPASAVSTLVVSADAPPCDVLSIPTTPVEELGLAPPFPVGEQISAIATTTAASACSSLTADNPLIANALVSITNLNSIAFSAVWYVADYDTTLSNLDGLVLSVPAFRIDAVGTNTPLVAESGAVDGIFSPGETWTFIIQDYANTFSLPADAINSVGLPSAGLGSSGSIVAVPVPEPTPAALLGLGLLGMSLARRRDR